MSQNVTFIKLQNSIVFHFNGTSVTVEKGTKEYERALTAIKTNNLDSIPEIVDKKAAFTKSVADSPVRIEGQTLYIDGEIVDNYVSKKIIEFFEQGLPFAPLVNFWRRLKCNPEPDSIKQLYRFLEVAECPITEEGLFICMKGVDGTSDPKVFTSRHDRKFAYTLGIYSFMDRSKIPSTPHEACGPGLHGGSIKYARNWASIVIELLVDPADVVSVPLDCNSEKLRACRVLPLAVHEGEKYLKGMAIVASAAEEKSMAVKTMPSATTEGGTAFIINKVTYKEVVLTEEEYNSAITNEVGVITNLQRYRASKAPATIRNNFTGLAGTFKCSFSGINEPVYMFAYADGFKMLLPQETDVKILSIAFASRVAIETKETLSFTECALVGRCQFAGKAYVCGFAEGLDIETLDIENENISSVMPIKPSKIPVGIQSLLHDVIYEGVSKLKRFTLTDETVVFSMNVKYKKKKGAFIFRQE